jgi:hypothetical protein
VERCSDHQFIECGGGRFREERRYCLACVCVCERERERERDREWRSRRFDEERESSMNKQSLKKY